MSDNASVRTEQLQTIGKVIFKLRKALDLAGLQDKLLIYTTRYNAFWDDSSRPAKYGKFSTDGEGIIIENTLKTLGSSLKECLSASNIMMYDVNPVALNAPNGFTLDTYKAVFGAFEKYVEKHKVVMGFEPGGQAAGGKWEGMVVDK